MKKYNRVLTIAGSDSGAGAGIQADIKSASACGCFATSVITAITAQNTKGVTGIHIVPADSVRMQIEAVLSDIGTDALKLGMLPTPEIIDVVAEMIDKYEIKNVVLDPVMIATSGDKLVSDKAIDKIINKLLPLSRVVTPNVPEAEFITGLKINKISDSVYGNVAKAFFDKGTNAVLLKSGHMDSDSVVDYLFDGEVYKYPYTKIKTLNTHGTGCTLSSAIAAFLARGYSLPLAVEQAENYIHGAIDAGSDYTIGEGHGSVHHFFKFW